MQLATLDLLARGGRGDGEFFFFPFLFFLLLIGALIWFIRRRRGTLPSQQRGSSARDVLDTRFARGEIDRAEYDHRRAVLDGDDTIPPAPPASATAVADPPPQHDPLANTDGDHDTDGSGDDERA